VGVQRTVLCPGCHHPRSTKATGRQQLACTSCGHRWLVRDSQLPEPEPATTPLAQGAAPAAPRTGTTAAGDFAGVDVLAPAALSIGPLAFPEPAPPSEPTAAPAAPPAAAAVENVPPAEPQPEPAAAVLPGPGRRAGYYARVVGGRR
jgi:hypothetical protein